MANSSGTPDKSSQFSPVVVSSAVLSANVNLTGVPRKIKDSCADIYNFVQKWNKLNADGTLLMNRIATSKMRSLENKDDGSAEAPNELEVPNFQTEKLSGLCSLLLDVWKNMEEQLNRVLTVEKNLKALVELQECRNDADDIPFQTWRVGKFHEAAQKVASAYAEELQAKRCLLEEVAQLNDSKSLSLFVTAWSYQPYVDEDCKLFVEAMVHEVGFK